MLKNTSLIIFLTFIINSFCVAQLKLSVKNGKYGFVDVNGKTVIDHKYSQVEDFYSREFTEARLGKQKIYLHRTGKEYLLAKSIEELSEMTEALVITDKKLVKIPQKVFESNNLKILLLQGNEINILPKEIGTLKELTRLNLSYNKLSFLPAEIGQLKNLLRLDLFGNNLSNLPPEIGQLSKLEVLKAGSLDSVKLVNLPKEIGKLTNLKELDLRFNKLTKMPTELSHLTNLRELDLWINLQLDFSSLCTVFEHHAQKVIFSENVEDYFNNHIGTLVILVPIGSIVASEAFKVNNLVEIQVDNRGYYVIPEEEINFLRDKKPTSTKQIAATKKLLGKKTFNWSGYGLKKLPKEIGKLKKAESLNLNNNKLTKLSDGIRKLVNLKTLELKSNQFSEAEKEKIKKWLPNCTVVF